MNRENNNFLSLAGYTSASLLCSWLPLPHEYAADKYKDKVLTHKHMSSHMGTYAIALKNRDFLDLIISVEAYWGLYLSALYMYVKLRKELSSAPSHAECPTLPLLCLRERLELESCTKITFKTRMVLQRAKL